MAFFQAEGNLLGIPNGNTNPLSMTTIIDAATRIIFCFINTQGATGRAGGAPYFSDGLDTFTQIDTQRKAASSPEGVLELWWTTTTTTGSRTLNIPNTALNTLGFRTLHFYSNSGYPVVLSSYTGSSGTGTPASAVLTVTGAGMGYCAVASGQGDISGVTAIDGTLSGNQDNGTRITAQEYNLSVSSDWTAGINHASEDWALIACLLRESVPSTGTFSNSIGDIFLSAAGTVVSNVSTGALAQSIGEIVLSSAGTVITAGEASPSYTHSRRKKPSFNNSQKKKEKKEEEIFEVQPSTLENIDWAFYDWVDKELDLFCNTQDGWEKTPVIWSDSERVFHIKNNKDLRESSGSLELPLISVRRGDIGRSLTEKGQFFANLNTDEKGGVARFKRRIKHEKTANHRNEQSLDEYGKINFWYPENRAKKVLYEYINLPQFSYVNIEYKISIKTSHIQQMNTLVQPFLSKPGSINYFVFGREGHKYEGFLPEEFPTEDNAEGTKEEERFFKTTITVKTIGYITEAGENSKTPKIKRGESIVEVKIPREYVMLDWDEDEEN